MHFKSILRNMLQSPVLLPLYEALVPTLRAFRWRKRGYTGPRPQFIKKKVLEKYGVAKAQWIETGTYLGTTTKFLSARAPQVYSLEPEKQLFERAQKRFRGSNVTLINAPSESTFPELLPNLKGDINFWLDGHYSAGATFLGEQISPISEELNEIENSLGQFEKVAIFIDDVRLFSDGDDGYPSLDTLVDFARKNKMQWSIENDIFIIRNF